MSSKLENVINLLCKGKCLTLNELQKEAHMCEEQIRATVAFLVKYGFAEMNKEVGVRIARDAKKFFTQTL